MNDIFASFYQFSVTPCESCYFIMSEKHPSVSLAKQSVSYLPRTFIPYAQLARIEKPVGTIITYFPHLFGTLFLACLTSGSTSGTELLKTCGLMLIASFALRSFGCTWNDIMDRDLDKQVARCRNRPLARDAIPVWRAYVFCAAELLLWCGIMTHISTKSLCHGFPIILLTAIYPFAKRFTNFAQLVLGVTFSWGVVIGASSLQAQQIDKIVLDTRSSTALAMLFLEYVLWTMIYDTIYALQDVQDDMKAGIKSMAVRYKDKMKYLLSMISVALVATLAATGFLVETTLAYYVEVCGATSLLLLRIVKTVDFEDPKACLWWFQRGSVVYGMLVTLGLLHEYCVRRYGWQTSITA